MDDAEEEPEQGADEEVFNTFYHPTNNTLPTHHHTHPERLY